MDEVMTMVRKSSVPPPRKVLEEGQEVPDVPFISEVAAKAEGAGGDEGAGAVEGENGGAENRAEEGEHPNGQGQSVVFAFKLIALLTKAFPQMVGYPFRSLSSHNLSLPSSPSLSLSPLTYSLSLSHFHFLSLSHFLGDTQISPSSPSRYHLVEAVESDRPLHRRQRLLSTP